MAKSWQFALESFLEFIMLRIFSICLLVAVLFVLPAVSEDLTAFEEGTLDTPTPLEFGLTMAEIQERYGAPDQKQIDQNRESERWHYGKSVVLFQAGKVSGWTYQPGDFEGRFRKESRVRGESVGEAPYLIHGWKDAWRREIEITEEDAIDELCR